MGKLNIEAQFIIKKSWDLPKYGSILEKPHDPQDDIQRSVIANRRYRTLPIYPTFSLYITSE